MCQDRLLVLRRLLEQSFIHCAASCNLGSRHLRCTLFERSLSGILPSAQAPGLLAGGLGCPPKGHPETALDQVHARTQKTPPRRGPTLSACGLLLCCHLVGLRSAVHDVIHGLLPRTRRGISRGCLPSSPQAILRHRPRSDQFGSTPICAHNMQLPISATNSSKA